MDYREKLEELKGYVVKGLIVGGLLGTIPAGMIAIGTWERKVIFLLLLSAHCLCGCSVHFISAAFPTAGTL